MRNYFGHTPAEILKRQEALKRQDEGRAAHLKDVREMILSAIANAKEKSGDQRSDGVFAYGVAIDDLPHIFDASLVKSRLIGVDEDGLRLEMLIPRLMAVTRARVVRNERLGE